MTEGIGNQQLAPTAQAVPTSARGLELRSLEEVYRFAKLAVMGGLAPKGDTIEAAACKVVFGRELGLSAAQSLTALANINGKCALYGDGMLGVLKASGMLVGKPVKEWIGNKPDSDDYGCRVSLKRLGEDELYVGEFTIAQAKIAGLWKKAGPWSTYPDRMLYWRALSWAAREGFPDVLRGIAIAEEQQDVVDVPADVRTKPPAQVVQAVPAIARLVAASAPPPATQAVDPLWDRWNEELSSLNPEQLTDVKHSIGLNPNDDIDASSSAGVLTRAINRAIDLLKEGKDAE
jgi:hypothetical protein